MLQLVFNNPNRQWVKFTNPKQTAVIYINTRESCKEEIISINDKGIGFDMQYHDKILASFTVCILPKNSREPGTDLANVLLIMQRRIWAKGRIDNGATFNLLLPREDTV